MGGLDVWLLLYIPLQVYIKEKTHTQRIQCNWKKTQQWLSYHEFISAKNIIFVSSDDIHPQIKRVCRLKRRRLYSSSK